MMDEKDWIIVRLLRLLLRTGEFASHPDVIKSIQWFEQENRDFGNREINGEIVFGPLYGTGHAKLLDGIKRVKEAPVYNRATGKWDTE